MEVQELKEQIAETIYRKFMTLFCNDEETLAETHIDSMFTKKIADSILSLLDSPDSPYIKKSEVVKRIREAELTPEEIYRAKKTAHKEWEKTEEYKNIRDAFDHLHKSERIYNNAIVHATISKVMEGLG